MDSRGTGLPQQGRVSPARQIGDPRALRMPIRRVRGAAGDSSISADLWQLMSKSSLRPRRSRAKFRKYNVQLLMRACSCVRDQNLPRPHSSWSLASALDMGINELRPSLARASSGVRGSNPCAEKAASVPERGRNLCQRP